LPTTTYRDIEEKLKEFLARQKDAGEQLDTGVNRETYLDIVEGNVNYFAPYQDDRGAIMDPVLGGEKQYATPCFAAAAACLVRFRRRTDLLEASCRALTFSLECLTQGVKQCNNHGNFYTTQVMHAYLWLKDCVEVTLVEHWNSLFANVHSYIAYRQAFHNWSVVAQAGEAMRLQHKLGGSLDEIDENLGFQIPLITELGMYVDPNGPLAYDLFTRLFFRMMLNHDYNGRHKNFLEEMSLRGAIISLFMQSPTGEILLGGRSAQHQWNEAEQCYVFESYANEFARRGDSALAGAFKRAAKLSLASVSRWVRPSGDLNIVRNWYDPSERVGYEGYSYHSQYNLLSAFMLAACYWLTDDSIEEQPCPADVGGFALWIEPHFHKVVANAGGYYAVVQTKGERLYNPTGIIRIQKRGMVLPVGPADMVPLEGNTEEGAISYAISTYYREKWQRAADMTRGELDEVQVEVIEEHPQRVVLQLTYIGGLSVNIWKRKLTLDSKGVTVEDESAMNFHEEIPILLFDGRTESDVTVMPREATVKLMGEEQRITIMEPGDEGLTLSGRTGISRNGKLGSLEYATKSKRTAFRVSLNKLSEGTTQ
jgi:hypothetical protein